MSFETAPALMPVKVRCDGGDGRHTYTVATLDGHVLGHRVPLFRPRTMPMRPGDGYGVAFYDQRRRT